MHIPDFRLIDRIKTRTVWSGVRYFGSIAFKIVLYKLNAARRDQNYSLDPSKGGKSIIDKFHILYAEKHEQTYDNTYWLGVRAMKCPLDLWIYQEILFKTKPDIIIETGTNEGGSSLFLANICDLMNHGEIVTIDIASIKGKPEHKRIHYLQGDATSKEIISKITELINKINAKPDKKIMVILDDEHSERHVLEEMEIYGKLVTVGNYMIVEDTSMGGHPVWPESGSGPLEAVQRYMQTHSDFEIDLSCEKFLLTFNPDGFLRKIRSN